MRVRDWEKEGGRRIIISKNHAFNTKSPNITSCDKSQ